MSDPVDELRERRTLDDEQLLFLLESDDDALVRNLHAAAREVTLANFGTGIYLRALVEWSNICRNDCLYCGIRRSNSHLERYSLSRESILQSCGNAHRLGLRTFVLQGGENPPAAEALVPLVAEMRASWPDSAITLSLGELPRPTYSLLRRSGADRYLLRHESADERHYARLHPSGMHLANRLSCLRTLRELGYQTGMGMMVGSPFQTERHLLADLRLLEAFRPEMIGIGPFIPHPDTPLGSFPAGSAAMTLRLCSILRLMHPSALIPATTALSTLLPDGRKAGILAGANVIMPNFTPSTRRAAYALYEGKASPAIESEENLGRLESELLSIGRTIRPVRGDHIEKTHLTS
ncbi:MAG: [Bacteroidales bacterium]|nr:[FeFe] hydrogenase H-cluster radical SAM maturase HydE [Bacteroidales bacterium]